MCHHRLCSMRVYSPHKTSFFPLASSVLRSCYTGMLRSRLTNPVCAAGSPCRGHQPLTSDHSVEFATTCVPGQCTCLPVNSVEQRVTVPFRECSVHWGSTKPWTWHVYLGSPAMKEGTYVPFRVPGQVPGGGSAAPSRAAPGRWQSW